MTERVRRPVTVQLPDFGIAVLESHHAAGFESPVLRHDYAKLVLVIAGAGVWKAGREALKMEPHTLLHVPASLPHRMEDDPSAPMSLYAVCYRPGIVRAVLPGHNARRWSLGNQAAAFRSDFREMLFEQGTRREGWVTLLVSRLGDLLVRTIRMEANGPSPRRVEFARGKDSAERVAAYAVELESRFYAAESLDEAARATGLSRRRFTQLFRKTTGQSWSERIRDLRLAHACKLLEGTTKPIIHVAFECGFDDLSHFHRLFKRAMGMPPLSFRKRRAG